MRTAKLLTTKGELLTELNLPESMSEVKLSQYVNFTKAMQDVEENYLPNVLKALSEFYGADLYDLLDAKFNGNPDVLDSVTPLFSYTHKLISEYNPVLRTGDLKITYKGETFFMKGYIGKQFDQMSTMEAYECLEARRLYSRLEDQDTEGNYLYTQYLRIIATLCRKENEELPVGDTERERFLTERIDFFRDIDAKTALDVDFFLGNIFNGSDQFPKINTFLIRQSLVLVAETKWRKQKPTRRQLRTRKKSLIG